jgi:hypothetical protein
MAPKAKAKKKTGRVSAKGKSSSSRGILKRRHSNVGGIMHSAYRRRRAGALLGILGASAGVAGGLMLHNPALMKSSASIMRNRLIGRTGQVAKFGVRKLKGLSRGLRMMRKSILKPNAKFARKLDIAMKDAKTAPMRAGPPAGPDVKARVVDKLKQPSRMTFEDWQKSNLK